MGHAWARWAEDEGLREGRKHRQRVTEERVLGHGRSACRVGVHLHVRGFHLGINATTLLLPMYEDPLYHDADGLNALTCTRSPCTSTP